MVRARLVRVGCAVLLALGAFLGSLIVQAPDAGAAPTRCPANPAPKSGYIRSGKLSTIRPNPVGYEGQGSWAAKQPWFRSTTGEVTITARRMDGTGTATYDVGTSAEYGPTGFVPSRIVFGSGGCWRVAGRLGTSRVVLYFRIDDSEGSVCRQLDSNLDNLDTLHKAGDDPLRQKFEAEQLDRGCTS